MDSTHNTGRDQTWSGVVGDAGDDALDGTAKHGAQTISHSTLEEVLRGEHAQSARSQFA